MDENITCSKCSKTFTARKNYYRHLKTFHPAVNIDYCRAKILCPGCDDRFPFMSSLHDHIIKIHKDVNLKFEELTFDSEEDFMKWKTATEYESVSRFIAKHGPAECNQQSKKHFYCHRSGSENIKSERKRKLKKGGSLKIGFACPAYIAVTQEKEEDVVKIKVKYQATHYGHLKDITRLALTKEERSHLAWKMSLGVPKSRLLQDISSFSSTERLSYLTNTDLNNIIRDFKIKKEIIKQAVSKEERSTTSKRKGVSKSRILKGVAPPYSSTERLSNLTNTDLNIIIGNFQVEGKLATHYGHRNEITRQAVPQKERSNVASKMFTAHDFSCICPDYAIKNEICEHIHLVARHYNNGLITQDHLVDDVEDSFDGKQMIISSLVDEKESVRGKVMDLLKNIMQKCESPDVASNELEMWNDCLTNAIQEVEQKKSALKMKAELVLLEEN